MAKKPIKKITAHGVMEAIKHKYSDKGRYVVLEEVAQGTGAHSRSWIDALVMHLWPSDGMYRLAFEIKTSRQDFLSELNNRKKNDVFKGYCHEFWYATAKDVVTHIDEIPEGCGWMCMRGETLSIKKQATRAQEVKNDDTFTASIARSCQKALGRDQKKMKDDLIKSDPEYKSLKRLERAVEQFMFKRGERIWYTKDTADEMFAELMKAASDDKEKEDFEQMMGALGKIQERCADFFIHFLNLSQNLLADVNEQGNYLVNGCSWRGGSSSSKEKWSLLNALIKNIKQQRHSYNKPEMREQLKFFKELLKENKK